jgi:parallel beta-helix repeat protein
MNKIGTSMKKGKLIGKIFGIVLVFVMIMGVLNGSPVLLNRVEASPVNIYVPDNYPTIQAAVDAASPGDTIIVRDGTYMEHVTVTKTLTLQSENGAQSTIINAQRQGSPIEIQASSCVIDGFTVTQGFLGFSDAGIKVKYYTGGNNVIKNNIAYGNTIGIYAQKTSNNLIINNTVYDNDYRGIDCCVEHDDYIVDNRVYSNNEFGIILSGSSDTLVEGNIIYSHDDLYFGAGIWIDGSGNIVGRNALSQNTVGIGVESGSGNVVIGNNITSNANGIVYNPGVSNNLLFLNNFIGNANQVGWYCCQPPGTNVWNSPEELTYTYNGNTCRNYLGNFWSDYSVSDANGDGIGDTHYSIDSDKDNYPLISPFENYGNIDPQIIRPSNSSPCDGAIKVDLTPTLQSSVFFDLDAGDTHAASRWQITTIAGNYSSPVFDTGVDDSNLTSIAVPSSVLNYCTTYYWHVRYQDNHSAWSSWSTETSFTTVFAIATATGTGMAIFTADSGTIENLTAISENALPPESVERKPNIEFAHGFFSFNITGLTSGATVTVTIELPFAVRVGTQYWKYGPTPYNPTDHWYQLPMGHDDGDNVITITLVDGDLGDDDLIANGVIVDSGGPGASPVWCFIATAAYGTPMAEEVQILREFRDEYLLTNPLGLTFVDFYYKVSPPIAEFITEHPSLKPIVRVGLMPAVVMSAVAVNTTPAEKMSIIGLLALVSVALAVWATKRRGRGPEYA